MDITKNFKVIIEQDEDGIFIATAPAIPGCHTQGKTYEQALDRIQEAIELCLEVAQTDDAYRDTIDLPEDVAQQPRFVGVVQVPIRFKHA